MFDGSKMTIEGKEYVVPALSLGQLRRGILAKLREHDETLGKGDIFGAMLIRGEVIFAALQRNYPDLTQEKFEDAADLSNTGTIWLAVLGSSGFTPGEEQAAGTAATEKTSGTSGQSTEA